MIGFNCTTQINTAPVKQAEERANFRNLGHAAATLRNDAIGSIVAAEGPSQPGAAPHTHTSGTTKSGKHRRGDLQRAIAYDVDKTAESALIGPRESVVGLAGEAHEFGGDYKSEEYPERPFMGPALERNLDRFPTEWAGSIGEG